MGLYIPITAQFCTAAPPQTPQINKEKIIFAVMKSTLLSYFQGMLITVSCQTMYNLGVGGGYDSNLTATC